MAILPADLYIAQTEKYREIARLALDVAREPGRMVVLGIPPTRPDTGFGYIQSSTKPISTSPFPVFAVEAFKEKPQLALAEEYVASGNYRWNAGMFFWRVSTVLDALQKYLPKTSAELESSPPIGTKNYQKKLRAIYPRLENIAVDYAILEPATRESGASRVFVIPADIGWSDIGSWTAVYEQSSKSPEGNVIAGASHAIDAKAISSGPGQIRRSHRRPRPRRRRNTRRLAHLPPPALPGRRKNREMARRASQKRSALKGSLKVPTEVPIRLLAHFRHRVYFSLHASANPI